MEAGNTDTAEEGLTYGWERGREPCGNEGIGIHLRYTQPLNDIDGISGHLNSRSSLGRLAGKRGEGITSKVVGGVGLTQHFKGHLEDRRSCSTRAQERIEEQAQKAIFS